MTINQNEITITEEESKCCKLCNKIFNSGRLMIWHVKKEHKLDFKNYILQVYYGGINPICQKTGKNVTFKAHKLGPWFSNYSKNNFPRSPHSAESKEKIRIGCENAALKKFGVKNVFQSEWCKLKIKSTIREKYGVDNPMQVDDFKKKMINAFFETIKNRPIKVYPCKNIDPNRPSTLELDFASKLTKNNIHFITPFVYDGYRFDFYIPAINSIIEIDGETFHKNNLESLTLMTINGSRNDYNKNIMIDDSLYNFYRIRYNPADFNFDDIISLESIIHNTKYYPNYGIKYKQKIVNKEYFARYIANKGKDKLQKYSPLILKFIRTFQPEFPYPDLEEQLFDVIGKLHNTNISKVYNDNAKEFSNNISTAGHNYLKHHFKSYWKSKFKGTLSPVEAWKDDKIMQEVIDYRIGCNNSGEVFDFSLHQLVRGLSARRIGVSFFKPLLAAAIYKIILGNMPNPVVLDPCCGFGGRLLGFKSIYPNGTYVGCEPNVETYNELLQLVKNAGWNNVEIHNCKFENFNDKNRHKFDLIFTSIPYFDIEEYSNNTTYPSFDDWKNTFISAIEKHGGTGCYINAPSELCEKLKWVNVAYTIKSNRSHFDKRAGTKKELIVKL
jgi:hypothetical protein